MKNKRKKLPWYKRIFTIEQVELELSNERSINTDDLPPSDPAEPWITIKGFGQNKGQIQLELDWNDAFIEYLKRNGFVGTSDEQMVQKYIAVMHRNLMSEMNDGNEYV